MSKVLVTGGHGFIGTHLAKYLMAAGHEVTIIDRSLPAYGEAFFCNSEVKELRLYMKELETAGAMPSIFGDPEPFDYIFHLAATQSQRNDDLLPELVLQNNTSALVEILGYCRRNPSCKLIFASSATVKSKEPLGSPSVTSKVIGEQLISMYIDHFGISATSVRLFTVYGTGDDYRSSSDSTIITRCKRCVKIGTPIIQFGDGTKIPVLTHVMDIVEGFHQVMLEMEKGSTQKIYELGSDSTVTEAEIFRTFAENTDTEIFQGGHLIGFDTIETDKSAWPPGWYPVMDVTTYINHWKKTELYIE